MNIDLQKVISNGKVVYVILAFNSYELKCYTPNELKNSLTILRNLAGYIFIKEKSPLYL